MSKHGHDIRSKLRDLELEGLTEDQIRAYCVDFGYEGWAAIMADRFNWEV